ncbi:glycosyltransferase family 2 protein [Thermoproteota archaeon]
MKEVTGKISVIMPAFNEASVIEHNIKETIETFKRFEKEFEIIIIDDGSTDDTWEKIKELAAGSFHIKATRNMQNYGKGRALKKGFRFPGF